LVLSNRQQAWLSDSTRTYRPASFNTLAFGEINPYSGSLKDGRLDLVYYRDPGLTVGDLFPVWTLR